MIYNTNKTKIFKKSINGIRRLHLVSRWIPNAFIYADRQKCVIICSHQWHSSLKLASFLSFPLFSIFSEKEDVVGDFFLPTCAIPLGLIGVANRCLRDMQYSGGICVFDQDILPPLEWQQQVSYWHIIEKKEWKKHLIQQFWNCWLNRRGDANVIVRWG